MSPAFDHDQLDAARQRIAARVRELRASRRLTQRQLARLIGLSQSRLSELERGGGSFSAEQLLLLLRVFNVDIESFDAPLGSPDGALQNALIRFGAEHLRQVDGIAASERFRTVGDVVVAVLLHPTSERFVTALAPVLLRSSDDLSLPALQAELGRAGRPQRLPWLAENTVQALASLPADAGGPPRRKQALRASLLLTEFLDHVPPPPQDASAPSRDTLDRAIRTKASLERTWVSASAISRKWRIVSALQVEDFAQALRQALELA